jgi:hypothetical protein
MKTSRDLVIFFNTTDSYVQDSGLDLKSNITADFSPHRYRKLNIGKIENHGDNDNMYIKLV